MTQIGLFTLCIIVYALPDKWYDQWSLTPGCVLNSFTFNLMLWTICTYLSVLILVNWTTEAPLSPKGLGQTVAYIRHARLVESTQICDECVWESALVPFQQPKLAHVLFTEPDCQPKLAQVWIAKILSHLTWKPDMGQNQFIYLDLQLGTQTSHNQFDSDGHLGGNTVKSWSMITQLQIRCSLCCYQR